MLNVNEYKGMLAKADSQEKKSKSRKEMLLMEKISTENNSPWWI